MSSIRKWFLKQHEKRKANAQQPPNDETLSNSIPAVMKELVPVEEHSGRKKSSNYFAPENQTPKDDKKGELLGKRKAADAMQSPAKKFYKADDDDFVVSTSKNGAIEVPPTKKLKTGSGSARKPVELGDFVEEKIFKTKSHLKPVGRGQAGCGSLNGQASMVVDENDEDYDQSSKKAIGPGHGRGGSTDFGGGRGNGRGGRGGLGNFGEKKDPPHKGEKEVPKGAPECLAGLTFVISGTLDSLEREEAEDLIKRHGGRVTGAVSKKMNYLLCDEDIGGRKSAKAKELGTGCLTEDGLFDMISSSKKGKSTNNGELKKNVTKAVESSPKKTPRKFESKSIVSRRSVYDPLQTELIATESMIPIGRGQGELIIGDRKTGKTAVAMDTILNRQGKNVIRANYSAKRVATKDAVPAKKKYLTKGDVSSPWTVKYRPTVPNEIVGNQSLVKQLEDWLKDWDKFFHAGSKEKGTKKSDLGQKAVLLSGTPGIGKTTSAKMISQMLGFHPIEVNASDNRRKADPKIEKGIGGSTANSIKELVSNQALTTNIDNSKPPKIVLIMDEVDGMSAGDRGGVADLIASIKISKVPIICICNDRYSQILKSLVNYCLLLNFRKPTKQQMAKKLMQVAKGERVRTNEVALEELAERVHGDMRMALNQLQYMSLSKSLVKYDDVRQRLLSSTKDEDISPFTAVDKLFGFHAGKLRMDEQFDLSMSDPDLVPLIIQENYINYKPSSVSKDDNRLKRLKLISRAADSIANGDIVNVQIRRYRQWQFSQFGTLASCIIPSVLLHGQRETLQQGERNFNRFGGWLGKNSTTGKNVRLLENMHIHLLASRAFSLGRETLRLDYLNVFLKELTNPLKVLSKEEAVGKVLEFMDSYSISQKDFDTVVEMSKFKGHANPLDGVPSVVKAALRKAYNKGPSSRVIRTADLITVPGMKKAPKKQVAAMFEPVDGLAEENGNTSAENEEENPSDTEDLEATGGAEKKLQLDLQSLTLKGIQVKMDMKVSGNTSAKKPTSVGRGGKASIRERGSADLDVKRKR